ncbi:MAG TPA: DUF5668 domain-containing protein [Terriglobales bacterium]|nr:DUF5668 domain-containing protein [Terriglobales bacterium]
MQIAEGRSRRHCRGLFVPLVLIGLGIIFLLDQFHVLYAGDVFAYFWPVVLMLFGVELLSGRSSPGRTLWGVVAIGAGIALVMRNLGYWSFDIGRLWPLVLIGVGLSLLFRGDRHCRYYGRRRRWRGRYGDGAQPVPPDDASAHSGAPSAPTSADRDASLDSVAVLAGVQRRITAQNFTGGRVVAFFGGFNLDLTRANIAGDAAELELNALFGGGEVRVPETWIIDLRGHALLGAYSDETHQNPPASGAKRLVVQGTAVFGGVVIKN